jgi:hypothetical protein
VNFPSVSSLRMAEVDTTAIVGIILAFVTGILANKATPILDRVWARMKESVKSPPLNPADIPKTKSVVKNLKNEMEEITNFRKSLTDLYLFALGEIAFGLLYLSEAALIGIGLGIGYVLLQATPPEARVNPDVLQALAGIGFLGLMLLVARSSWRFMNAARTIYRVRDYDRYKTKTEARIVHLEQQLNDFYKA